MLALKVCDVVGRLRQDGGLAGLDVHPELAEHPPEVFDALADLEGSGLIRYTSWNTSKNVSRRFINCYLVKKSNTGRVSDLFLFNARIFFMNVSTSIFAKPKRCSVKNNYY